MHKIVKKIGFGFLTVVPAVLLIVFNLLSSLIVSIIAASRLLIENPQLMNNFEEYTAELMKASLALTDPMMLMYQGMALLCFGLWYVLCYGRKKRPAYAEKMKLMKLPVIVLLGVMLQIVASGFVTLMSLLLPTLVAQYNQMIHMAGLDAPSVLAVISAVIMAPIVEELCFRGLTYKFAKKIWNSWIFANILQALLFGIVHMNLIQGLYAFILGLLFGYIYEKYHNLFVCMLLHAAINGSGFLYDWLTGMIPGPFVLLCLIVMNVIALVVVVLCLKILGRVPKRPREEEEVVVKDEHTEEIHHL